MQSFKIHVTKDYLMFCSGHFITYSGHQCEPLHGHNYRVGVFVEGALNEDWYVFDFVTLKRLMKRLIDDLDHRMLLPLHNPWIKISQKDDHVIATYKERIYMFPQGDVVLLPIENTTAELLARYLAGRAKADLARYATQGLSAIEVEVEETTGQSAIYRETLEG